MNLSSLQSKSAFAAAFVLCLAATLLVGAEDPITAPEKRDTRPGQVLATFTTSGQIWSSAVHEAGTVYVGSDDGAVWAFSLEDLALKWNAHTGGRVRSTPAVVEGSVYFASDDGFLYCVAASDGSRSWRFDLHGAGIERILPSVYPPYAYDYLSSSPTVHQGLVFVGSANGTFYAIDAATGKEKWHFKTGDRIRSTPAIHGKRVYFGSWDHHLYALDIENGKQVWRFDTGGVVQASPAIAVGWSTSAAATPRSSHSMWQPENPYGSSSTKTARGWNPQESTGTASSTSAVRTP